MSYALVILLLFIALSPLISAMPSRRQRHIADLRQAAAVSGLYVQLREPPVALPEGVTWTFYGRRRDWDDEQSPARLLLQAGSNGEWLPLEGVGEAVEQPCLKALPAGVALLVRDPEGAGVFWNERGEKNDVLAIDRVLRDLLGQR